MSSIETVYRGKIVDITIEQVELPGVGPAELEVVHHPGGAAVAALDTAGRLCMLRQYRHVAGGWLWELPAGKIDHGEDPRLTARRELEEEAGVRALRWDDLGVILSSPGIFTERIHLYLARELESVPTHHEHHEVIEVHWMPYAEARARAISGDISDAKTIAAIFRAAAFLDTQSPPLEPL